MWIRAGAIIVLLLTQTNVSEAQKRPTSKTYTFGKPTQNITPRHVRETQRSDGKTSRVYGNSVDSKGRVTGPHGHSVSDSGGKPVYHRTIGGKVLYDDKNK